MVENFNILKIFLILILLSQSSGLITSKYESNPLDLKKSERGLPIWTLFMDGEIINEVEVGKDIKIDLQNQWIFFYGDLIFKDRFGASLNIDLDCDRHDDISQCP